MNKKETKLCFVISPIGKENSPERKRSDSVLEYLIKPIAEKFGFKVTRSDKIALPGLITNQIIQHLIEDDLVIADLTDHNPNVFYELAIRHFVQKPFIQIYHPKEKLPFDVAGLRSIKLDTTDIRSYEKCKIELVDQIRSILEKPDEIITPITKSLFAEKLFMSDKPVEKAISEVLISNESLFSEIHSLREELDQIKSTLDHRSSGYFTQYKSPLDVPDSSFVSTNVRPSPTFGSARVTVPTVGEDLSNVLNFEEE